MEGLRGSRFGSRVSGFGLSGWRGVGSGPGFQVSGQGVEGGLVRVQVLSSGFQVSGFEFRVSGFGFMVSGFGLRG